jgi:hypothetical protein
VCPAAGLEDGDGDAGEFGGAVVELIVVVAEAVGVAAFAGFGGVDEVGHFAGGGVMIRKAGVVGGALLEVAVEGGAWVRRGAWCIHPVIPAALRGPWLGGGNRGCSQTRGAGALDPRLISVAPTGHFATRQPTGPGPPNRQSLDHFLNFQLSTLEPTVRF